MYCHYHELPLPRASSARTLQWDCGVKGVTIRNCGGSNSVRIPSMEALLLYVKCFTCLFALPTCAASTKVDDANLLMQASKYLPNDGCDSVVVSSSFRGKITLSIKKIRIVLIILHRNERFWQKLSMVWGHNRVTWGQIWWPVQGDYLITFLLNDNSTKWEQWRYHKTNLFHKRAENREKVSVYHG